MRIDIFNDSLQRVLTLDNRFISCYWSEGYNTIESFTLELPFTKATAANIKEDYFVERGDRDGLMVIKSVEVRDNRIIASGKEAKRILDDTVYAGTIPANSRIDTGISNAYNDNSGDVYGKSDLVTFSSPTGFSVTYPSQISNKSFLEFCETMCQETGSGFKSRKAQGGIDIYFFKPEQNDNVIFSDAFGNLKINSIVSGIETYKNYAVILGMGSGEQRIKTTYDARTDPSEKMRPIIVDARDIQQEDGQSAEDYIADLQTRGFEKLVEQVKTFEVDFTPLTAEFGKTFDLGDIITINALKYGLKMTARVVRYNQTIQENKIETAIEIGNLQIVRRKS